MVKGTGITQDGMSLRSTKDDIEMKSTNFSVQSISRPINRTR